MFYKGYCQQAYAIVANRPHDTVRSELNPSSALAQTCDSEDRFSRLRLHGCSGRPA
jgi:hypothetical protein